MNGAKKVCASNPLDPFGMLQRLVDMICGRHIPIVAGRTAYTDGKRIYIPTTIKLGSDEELIQAFFLTMHELAHNLNEDDINGAVKHKHQRLMHKFYNSFMDICTERMFERAYPGMVDYSRQFYTNLFGEKQTIEYYSSAAKANGVVPYLHALTRYMICRVRGEDVQASNQPSNPELVADYDKYIRDLEPQINAMRNWKGASRVAALFMERVEKLIEDELERQAREEKKRQEEERKRQEEERNRQEDKDAEESDESGDNTDETDSGDSQGGDDIEDQEDDSESGSDEGDDEESDQSDPGDEAVGDGDTQPESDDTSGDTDEDAGEGSVNEREDSSDKDGDDTGDDSVSDDEETGDSDEADGSASPEPNDDSSSGDDSEDDGCDGHPDPDDSPSDEASDSDSAGSSSDAEGDTCGPDDEEGERESNSGSGEDNSPRPDTDGDDADPEIDSDDRTLEDGDSEDESVGDSDNKDEGSVDSEDVEEDSKTSEPGDVDDLPDLTEEEHKQIEEDTDQRLNEADQDDTPLSHIDEIKKAIEEEFDNSDEYIKNPDVVDKIVTASRVSEYEGVLTRDAGLLLLGPEAPQIVNLFVQNTRPHVLRYQKRGRLDYRRVNDPRDGLNVKKQTICGMLEQSAVMIMVDYSASMSYPERKDIVASQLTSGLLHILNKGAVPCAAFGYTDYTSSNSGSSEHERDYPIHIEIIKKFDEVYSGDVMCRCHTGHVSNCTPDLDAMREYAIPQLLSRREKNKILFVICDGCPETPNPILTWRMAQSYMRYIHAIKKEGIKVFAFGIETNLNHFFDNDWMPVDTRTLGSNLVSKLREYLFRKDLVCGI